MSVRVCTRLRQEALLRWIEQAEGTVHRQYLEELNQARLHREERLEYWTELRRAIETGGDPPRWTHDQVLVLAAERLPVLA